MMDTKACLGDRKRPDTVSNLDLPFLLDLIRELRPDLCRLFPAQEDASGWDRWMGWLVTCGVKEYRALTENEQFRHYLAQPSVTPPLTRLQHLIYQERPDVQKACPLPQRLHDFVAWFYHHGVAEHELWPLLSEEEQSRTLTSALDPFFRTGDNKHPLPLAATRPHGVNLIGYAHGQLGIGEDLRMAARALLAAKIPFSILNFPPGPDIPQNDRSIAEHVRTEGPYAINVFCLTALEHGRYFAEHGQAQFQGRYNIGYWPWELGAWPKAWEGLTRLVDEVWVSTRHTYDALSPVSPAPVLVMPMAVELGPVTDVSRAHFTLPEQATLFCFAFDLKSSMHRKNPQACVDAFQRAFPLDDGKNWGPDKVGLVIKCHRPAKRHPAWERLKAQAALDPRLHIVEETLSRPDLLALYRCCDCFLSLHRAEGFGRGIAEALLLGLHVIATGYSGNMDFCTPPQADLVRSHPIKIRKGQYPYGEGQVWAEPNVDHAATLMRSFVERIDRQKYAIQWPRFSAVEVGKRYAQRIDLINSWISFYGTHQPNNPRAQGPRSPRTNT
ncbi:MAG: glycosyltransferase family 1 protein [Clostridia bacterium]|nr:glycosyltransferase family 1 protein [Clostridia bacterium]